jgi:hypothetical protein
MVLALIEICSKPLHRSDLAAKEMEEDDELPATVQPSDGLLNSGGSRRYVNPSDAPKTPDR